MEPNLQKLGAKTIIAHLYKSSDSQKQFHPCSYTDVIGFALFNKQPLSDSPKTEKTD